MVQEELQLRNIPFTFLLSDEIPEEYSKIADGYPYIPMVFINGVFIGGTNATMEYLKDGKIIPFRP